MTPTLPFAPRAPGRPPDAPDIALAALPLLSRLRDALRSSDREAKRDRWGLPRLFFFDRALQAEWDAVRPVDAPTADVELLDLIDDVLSVLSACPLTRRAARAVPGLAAAATAVDHPRANELAELLAMPEDEVILVIHPTARAGFRLTTRGVVNLYQFHVLLAGAVTGDPGRGLLPGRRPDPDADIATARFQFYRPSALQPDGTLPPGFTGSDHWLWAREPLAAIPRLGDERVVLIADPIIRETWDTESRRVKSELDMLEVLSAAAVDDWIAGRTGRSVAPQRDVGRRAA